MCVSVLPACMMYVLQYAHAWGLQKPEEPLELELEVVMSYLLCRYWKLNPDPLPEQVTTDSSLQSYQHLFVKLFFLLFFSLYRVQA